MANVGAKLFLWISLIRLSSVVRGLVTLRMTNIGFVADAFVGYLGLIMIGLAALTLVALNVPSGQSRK